jgi:uncharacterized protein (TIGR02646 family)
MIYIEKKREVPAKFRNAVQGFTTYVDLPEDARTKIVKILLKEQGGLCAICERKEKAFTPTVEHFLPKSAFPHLQLDYHNLYIACQACNNPKDNHLIPAYMFDPRMDPRHANDLEGLRPKFEYAESACYIKVPAAEIVGKPLTFDTPLRRSAYILSMTLDLMEQNRPKLTKARHEVYLTFLKGIQHLSRPKLQQKWEAYQALPKNAPYDEFFSLKCQLLKTALKIR